MMILIFCKHSGQNNVRGAARTALSAKRCCIDMMISVPSEKTTRVIRLGPMAESRLYKIAHCSRVQKANQQHQGVRKPQHNYPSERPLRGSARIPRFDLG